MNQLNINLSNTILLVAVVYGLLFSGILLKRNWKKRNAHHWLGWFMFSFTLVLLDTYLKSIWLFRIYPFVLWTYYRLITLPAFFLWTYVVTATQQKLVIRTREKVMLFIVAVDFLYQVFSFVIGVLQMKSFARANRQFADTWLEIWGIIMSVFVLYHAVHHLKIYQQTLQNNYSAKEVRQNLQWLKELLLVLFAFVVIWVVVLPLDMYLLHLNISVYTIWLSQAIIIFYMGIKGHLQPEIFHEFTLSPSFKHSQNNKVTYENQTNKIASKQQESITQLENIMNEGKAYLQPKLNLRQVAKLMEMPTRQLSELINQHYQCSFSDFVNKYRVEEVKQRIKQGDDAQLTLLAIALEAGFNSKSSFNFMFKKFSGMTPKQFRTQHFSNNQRI